MNLYHTGLAAQLLFSNSITKTNQIFMFTKLTGGWIRRIQRNQMKIYGKLKVNCKQRSRPNKHESVCDSAKFSQVLMLPVRWGRNIEQQQKCVGLTFCTRPRHRNVTVTEISIW